MSKYTLYHKDGSEKDLQTLKDHNINVQAFTRMAWKEKARDLYEWQMLKEFSQSENKGEQQ